MNKKGDRREHSFFPGFLRSKKAALELSINAIVIIVIAMAVLGLGLGFVRSQIKNISETATTVQEQAKQNILDDLRTGNKRLAFPTDRITLSSGEVKDIAFGVQNLEASSIWVKVTLEKFDKAGQVWGTPALLPSTATDGDFFWDNSIQELPRGESKVMPIVYRAETDKDTYMYQIVVEYSLNAAGPFTQYAAKSFFVTTT